MNDIRMVTGREWRQRAERAEAALRQVREYAALIEADALTSLQSLRASLIQEVVDRALGDYPPKADQKHEG